MTTRRALTVATLQQSLILRGLSTSTIDRVIEAGSLEALLLRQQIYEAEEKITDVYFPLDAVLSVVARMEDGSEIEVGTIGREGTSAFPLLMGRPARQTCAIAKSAAPQLSCRRRYFAS